MNLKKDRTTLQVRITDRFSLSGTNFLSLDKFRIGYIYFSLRFFPVQCGISVLFRYARMRFQFYSADDFLLLSRSITNRTQSRSTSVRKYKSHFGIDPSVTSEAWNLIFVERSHRIATHLLIQPIHFLWTLLFLKTYATVDVLASLTGSDAKTIRKYMWPVLDIIFRSRHEFVSWARSVISLDLFEPLAIRIMF